MTKVREVFSASFKSTFSIILINMAMIMSLPTLNASGKKYTHGTFGGSSQNSNGTMIKISDCNPGVENCFRGESGEASLSATITDDAQIVYAINLGSDRGDPILRLHPGDRVQFRLERHSTHRLTQERMAHKNIALEANPDLNHDEVINLFISFPNGTERKYHLSMYSPKIEYRPRFIDP